MKALFWCLVFLMVAPLLGFAQPAQREASVSWQNMAAAAMNFSDPPTGSALADAIGKSASTPLTPTDGKTFPWPGTLEEMQKAFVLARDSRVIPWRADFARRPSWLYPDDGCYARAVVAADTLKRAGLPVPGKIFAFGDLSSRTNRSPQGKVTWWYHVAIAYLYAEDIYVFDPSVEEKQPLKLKEWTNRIGGESGEIKIALCDTKTYNPSDNCQNGNMLTTTSGFREQALYLDLEWERLLEMGKNPVDLLGALPIWE